MRKPHNTLDAKRSALEQAYFGQSAAEFDQALQQAFVETPIWTGILGDRINIVYGAKGSGKSAIAVLLANRSQSLRKRGFLIVNAESPNEEPVFQSLTDRPQLSEDQFVGLWKLYFLVLLGSTLRTVAPHDADARTVIEALEGAELLPREPAPLERLLQTVLRYVTVQLEAGLHASLPASPIGASGGIQVVLREPSPEMRGPGVVSIYQLLAAGGRALARARATVWFILDRLDIAFERDEVMEAQALRALFHAALALSPRDYHIRLKVFLRTDIWERIAGQFAHRADGINTPFRGAAAIQGERIIWDMPSLRSLIARRLVFNPSITSLYRVDPRKVHDSAREQQLLFDRIFPPRMPITDSTLARVAAMLPGDSHGIVETESTFEWMLAQVRDGTGQVAPRELILLLTNAQAAQLRRFAAGIAEDIEYKDQLFEPEALEEAVEEVSRARLFQTLFAEYPNLYEPVECLRGGQSRFASLEELQGIWKMSSADTQHTVALLTYLGFFGRVQARPPEIPTEWWFVPPIYRRALALRA